MKNIRSSQPCISMNFFSKAQVPPCEHVSIVKIYTKNGNILHSCYYGETANVTKKNFIIKSGVGWGGVKRLNLNIEFSMVSHLFLFDWESFRMYGFCLWFLLNLEVKNYWWVSILLEFGGPNGHDNHLRSFIGNLCHLQSRGTFCFLLLF